MTMQNLIDDIIHETNKGVLKWTFVCGYWECRFFRGKNRYQLSYRMDSDINIYDNWVNDKQKIICSIILSEIDSARLNHAITKNPYNPKVTQLRPEYNNTLVKRFTKDLYDKSKAFKIKGIPLP